MCNRLLSTYYILTFKTGTYYFLEKVKGNISDCLSRLVSPVIYKLWILMTNILLSEIYLWAQLTVSLITTWTNRPCSMPLITWTSNRRRWRGVALQKTFLLSMFTLYCIVYYSRALLNSNWWEIVEFLQQQLWQ